MQLDMCCFLPSTRYLFNAILGVNTYIQDVQIWPKETRNISTCISYGAKQLLHLQLFTCHSGV